MRGYSIMSDEERQNIISQHKSFYNGYSVGNVPSNMTPLTVYDAAQDKTGVNVNNRGEVSQYTNHQINEAKVEKDLVDEIEADDMDVSDVESAYDFDSKGPEQFDHSYSDDSYDLDLDTIMQMFGGLGDSDDMDELESDMNNEFDGREMMKGEKRAYDFDSDGGDVDVYGEAEETEAMCEQCGLSEAMCECGMYEEIDEDLQESFKAQKDRITEMFNRFKNYN